MNPSIVPMLAYTDTIATLKKSIIPNHPQKNQESEAVSKKFTSMFLAEMLRPMFQGTIKNNNTLLGNRQAEKVFTSFLIDAYADDMTEQTQQLSQQVNHYIKSLINLQKENTA